MSRKFSDDMSRAFWVCVFIASWCAGLVAADSGFMAFTKDSFESQSYEIDGLKGNHACIIGHPVKDVVDIKVSDGKVYPPGLYEIRIKSKASHVADREAWGGGLKVHVAGANKEWSAIHFARIHDSEYRTFRFVHLKRGPLPIRLEATMAAGEFEKAKVEQMLANNGVPLPGDAANETNEVSLELGISRKTHFYFVIEDVALKRVSALVQVEKVWPDKIMYRPGDKLKAEVTLRAFKKTQGKLQLNLEDDVDRRTLKLEKELSLQSGSQKFDFEFQLPEREYGYAIVAKFTDADGASNEAAEYFNIADNLWKVAIHYVGPMHGKTVRRSSKHFQHQMDEFRRNYVNCQEIFFWAEEDMVEMSPQKDHWFSGQTCYHMSKKGLQDYIKVAHENGVRITTYGKFIMYGPLAWKFIYDRPYHNKKSYQYPLGNWFGANVRTMDRLRAGELTATHFPNFKSFMTSPNPAPPRIHPDSNVVNVRFAAEEVMRSIEMFDWDAIRWDGHPFLEKSGLLIKFFKDTVAKKYPKFYHGYNYLNNDVAAKPEFADDHIDFNEACRDGGIVMNEALRDLNGHSFAELQRILQVQGDMIRARGGHYIGSSVWFSSKRDLTAESVLWNAGGCHQYTGVNRTFNRYATRYSRFVFDETRRRIQDPEKVISVSKKTKLNYQGFVYVTKPIKGKAQLIVNLINLPMGDRFKASEDSKKESLRMYPGTLPVGFRLNLPAGHRAGVAKIIDPFTLKVNEAASKDGNIEIPAVDIWKVLVVDLSIPEGANNLYTQVEQENTLANMKEAHKQPVEPFSIEASDRELTLQMEKRFPPKNSWWREAAELAKLDMKARNSKLMSKRSNFNAEKVKFDAKYQPMRNGRVDISYVRGVEDQRWRFYHAFARLSRFRVHESTLMGMAEKYSLLNLDSADQLFGRDLMVLADIPHPALSKDIAEKIPSYVQAGGGLFVAGGEFSFGRGGYLGTSIEKKILPVVCMGKDEHRYSLDPLPLEKGEHFSELGVEIDFSAAPKLWSWNEVAIREDLDVKVFLKSGNRPILVGADMGKGRVLCLLAMAKGRRVGDEIPFFEWDAWPSLLAKTLEWTAPRAGTKDAAIKSPFTKKKLMAIAEEMDGATAMQDLMDLEEDDGMGDDESVSVNVKLSPEDKRKRVSQIETLLAHGDKKMAATLMNQLPTFGDMPEELRGKILGFIAKHRPGELKEVAKNCMKSESAQVRGAGFVLSALAADANFIKLVTSKNPVMEVDPNLRRRWLAVASSQFASKALLGLARKEFKRLNDLEAKAMNKYTAGKGFGYESPYTPCLNSQDIVTRMGWLSYLAKHGDAKAHAELFAREWSRTDAYLEILKRQHTDVDPKTSKKLRDQLRFVSEATSSSLRTLRELTRPLFDELLEKYPREVFKGLGDNHMRAHALTCIDIIGNLPLKKIAKSLSMIEKTPQLLLRDFVHHRSAMLSKNL